MVKRIIAMLLGAVAGMLFWYIVILLRSPAIASGDPVAIEHCIRDALVDCVRSEQTPAKPDAAPLIESIAQPCKDWLSDDAGVAALSSCLHQARREHDAVRIENFKRAQRIASSS